MSLFFREIKILVYSYLKTFFDNVLGIYEDYVLGLGFKAGNQLIVGGLN